MILVNVLHVTKSVREILDRVKGEADGIMNDIADFRTNLRENLFGLKPILESFKKQKNEVAKKAKSRVRKVKKSITDFAKDVKNEINN